MKRKQIVGTGTTAREIDEGTDTGRPLEPADLFEESAEIHSLMHLCRSELGIEIGDPLGPEPSGAYASSRWYAWRILRALIEGYSLLLSPEMRSAPLGYSHAAWLLMFRGLEAGLLASEAKFKQEWEHYALQGKRRWEINNEDLPARSRQQREKWPKWQACADRVWDEHPEYRATDVSRIVAQRLGGNPDTIRRRIKKSVK